MTEEENIGLGTWALSHNIIGTNNAAIGSYAGRYNLTGRNNVFLGSFSGSDESGSNKLYINNNDGDANNSLIYGEFDNKLLTVNGKLGISTVTPLADVHIKQKTNYLGLRLEEYNSSNYWDIYYDNGEDFNFEYNGTLKGYIKDTDGVYVATSDARLKNNIHAMPEVLSKIEQLIPSQYAFTADRNGEISTGFIAQDVQKVFPEFVSEKEGYLRLGYDYFIPVAIKGIQELAAENKSFKAENQKMKTQIDELKNRMDEQQALIEKLMNKLSETKGAK